MTVENVRVLGGEQFTATVTAKTGSCGIGEEFEGVGDTMSEALLDLSEQLKERGL